MAIDFDNIHKIDGMSANEVEAAIRNGAKLNEVINKEAEKRQDEDNKIKEEFYSEISKEKIILQGNIDAEAQARTAKDTELQTAINSKADKKTEYGGFAAGDTGSSAAAGGAIGDHAKTNNGASVGMSTNSQNGAAVGANAYALDGAATGSGAHAQNGGAVGFNAITGNGFAGGKEAKTILAVGEDDTPIDAIQLGTGTNMNSKTLQVYDYQLMDADGNVPIERMAKEVEAREAKDTELQESIDKRVEFIQAYENELDELFVVGEGIYKVLGRERPEDGSITVDTTWRDYYIIARGQQTDNMVIKTVQIKVSFYGIYERLGVKDWRGIVGQPSGTRITWSEWTKYITQSEFDSEIETIKESIDSDMKSQFYGYKYYDGREVTDDSADFELVEGTQSVRCTNLTKTGTITVPYKIGDTIVTGIADNAFENSLCYEVIIPNTVESIGASAFKNATNLMEISIPDSVTSVKESAFEGCSSLNIMHWSDNTAMILANTFKNCAALSELYIGEIVHVIDETAFNGCTTDNLCFYTVDGCTIDTFAQQHNFKTRYLITNVSSEKMSQELNAEASAREAKDTELSAQIGDINTALNIQNEHINTSKDFLKIAYSSLVVGGINNAIHWLYASQMGFNALKGDVELTSDGELIMCHDTGFTFDTNGDIITFKSSNNTPINTLTHEQCMGLKYSAQLSQYGEYVYVADIDDFLKICKDKNKIAFITVRDRNTSADIDTYVKPVIDKLYDKLDFYGLKDRCIINHVNTSGSTDCLARPLDYIRNTLKDKSIKLNFVYNSSKAITNTVVDFVKALDNCYLSVWCNDSKTTIDNSESSIAYAKSNGVKLLACIIGTQSLYQYAIAKGFSGCQITKEIFDSEPQIIRFVIKIDGAAGTAIFSNAPSVADKYTADITIFSDETYTYLCIGNIRKNGSYLTRTRIINNESTECSYCDAVIPIMMNTLYPIINCRRDGYGTEVTADWVKTATISDTKPYYGYIRIKIKGNDIKNLGGNYPVSIVI